VDACGASALHGASRCGRLEAVRLLLRHGARADALDADGYSALDEAASDEVHEALLQQ